MNEEYKFVVVDAYMSVEGFESLEEAREYCEKEGIKQILFKVNEKGLIEIEDYT